VRRVREEGLVSIWTALLLAIPVAFAIGVAAGRWWAIAAAVALWLVCFLVLLPLTWATGGVGLEPGIQAWLATVYVVVTFLGAGLSAALCFIGLVVRRAIDMSRGLQPHI
jgi:hypothetical protein